MSRPCILAVLVLYKRTPEESEAFTSLRNILRIKALQEMNGFPEEFLLDYLDHATFRILQNKGGRIFVMQTTLEHKLSSNREDSSDDPVFSARQKNVLHAERAFYRNYGSFRERFFYHARLIWRAWKALRSGSFKRSILLLRQL